MKFNGVLQSKLPTIGTSIFAVMTKMAVENNAVNLSQGFPDFEVSPELIELINSNMRKGHNQYAPMPGLMQLRESIAEKTERLHKAIYNPETEITVTAGGTQAIYTAITALIKENDEVIVFEPAYDSYVPAIKLCGGIPITIKLKAPDFKIDWTEVQKLINQQTKMIIINTPHNPSGTVMSEDDMKMLEKLTKDTDIMIISDEVYEHIIFDGLVHQSVCKFPKLAERSIVIASFGKTFHATGWKMGYILAPENITTEIRKSHQFIVFCVNTPIQWALSEYLKNENNYLNLGSFYQEKRDYFLSLVKHSKFQFKPSSGTYFQLLDYSKIKQEKEMDFATWLTKEKRVASVPVSVFYHIPVEQNIIRVCFAKNTSTLINAAEILCNI